MSAANVAIAHHPETTAPARQRLRLVPPASSSVPTDGLTAYLRSIDSYPLLTAQEEAILGQEIEVGLLAQEKLVSASDAEAAQYRLLAERGRRATDRLVVCNLRLVVSVAKQYRGRGLELMDLIAEGNLGLIRAVQKYDYTLGYKFSTYAVWWIRQAVLRATATATATKARLVRLPSQVGEQVNRTILTGRRLERVAGRRPSEKDLAQELGIGQAEVRDLQRLASLPLSLDREVRADGELVPLAQVLVDETEPGPDVITEARMLPAMVDAAIATLPPREAEVIRSRFGLSGQPRLTLEEIGRRHGVSRERIRQIEKRGLQLLRHPSRSGLLRDYLV